MQNIKIINNLLLLEKVEEVKNLILEQKTIPNRKWIDFKCAIKYLGCSRSTLDRSLRSGRLRCSKINTKRMFKISTLDRFMEGK